MAKLSIKESLKFIISKASSISFPININKQNSIDIDIASNWYSDNNLIEIFKNKKIKNTLFDYLTSKEIINEHKVKDYDYYSTLPYEIYKKYRFNNGWVLPSSKEVGLEIIDNIDTKDNLSNNIKIINDIKITQIYNKKRESKKKEDEDYISPFYLEMIINDKYIEMIIHQYLKMSSFEIVNFITNRKIKTQISNINTIIIDNSYESLPRQLLIINLIKNLKICYNQNEINENLYLDCIYDKEYFNREYLMDIFNLYFKNKNNFQLNFITKKNEESQNYLNLGNLQYGRILKNGSAYYKNNEGMGILEFNDILKGITIFDLFEGGRKMNINLKNEQINDNIHEIFLNIRTIIESKLNKDFTFEEHINNISKNRSIYLFLLKIEEIIERSILEFEINYIYIYLLGLNEKLRNINIQDNNECIILYLVVEKVYNICMYLIE